MSVENANVSYIPKETVDTDESSACYQTDVLQQKIPDTTLTAVGTGTTVALQSIGVPTVLIFCMRETSGISEDVCRMVDTKYKLNTEVFVASVVNLEIVPRFFRFIAEGAMEQSYHDMLKKLPERLQDGEYVYILPDWTGAVTHAVELEHVNRTAGIVVLDAEGTIQGVYQGDNPKEATMEMLAKVMPETSDG
jgi:hypothetical protein